MGGTAEAFRPNFWEEGFFYAKNLDLTVNQIEKTNKKCIVRLECVSLVFLDLLLILM